MTLDKAHLYLIDFKSKKLIFDERNRFVWLWV